MAGMAEHHVTRYRHGNHEHIHHSCGRAGREPGLRNWRLEQFCSALGDGNQARSCARDAGFLGQSLVPRSPVGRNMDCLPHWGRTWRSLGVSLHDVGVVAACGCIVGFRSARARCELRCQLRIEMENLAVVPPPKTMAYTVSTSASASFSKIACPNTDNHSIRWTLLM